METRHPEISVHIKFEENKAHKGLKKEARRLGQKSKKEKERLKRWQNRRLALMYQDIPRKFWGEAVNTSCHIGN